MKGLQSNLLKVQRKLALQVASEVQTETYVFKKKGNEEQFNLNLNVIRTSSVEANALESSHFEKNLAVKFNLLSLVNSYQVCLSNCVPTTKLFLR